MEFFANLGEQQYNGEDNGPENTEKDEGFVEENVNQARQEPIDAEEWAEETGSDQEGREDRDTEQEARLEEQGDKPRHTTGEGSQWRTEEEERNPED